MWGAVALCIVLLFEATYVPVVADVLHVRPPSVAGWDVILIMSRLPLVVGQVVLAVRGSRSRRPDRQT